MAEGPLPAGKAARRMDVPRGFRVSLFAAEPDVVQPISFCLDDRGRLWVAEAHNYPNRDGGPNDRVLIFEDTDGDGRHDVRKVFCERLNYVTGVEVGFGGLWVMSPPCLLFVPDRDGDDRPDDKPRVVLDGFGTKPSAHNIATGFTWGPDGWLYGGHGRTSPSDVGPPGTPRERRVHFDGGVYRYHPTRHVFEGFADGTTNPWGVDFDDHGQAFVSNCVTPHLYHVIQGAHYEPWRNRPSSQHAYRRVPTIADHLHWVGNNPGKSAGGKPEQLAVGGGHAHVGCLVYLGDNWPDRYRNTVLMVNVHGKRINNDLLRRRGSGYVASHGADLLTAGDPWFMGVSLDTGPCGGVYLSDWSDTGECHTQRPQRHTGRLFKITYGEPPAQRAKVDLFRLDDARLVKLMLHKNDWYVRHARRLMQERAGAGRLSGDVAPALRKMFDEQEGVPRKLRALWALHVIGAADEKFLQQQLAHQSEYVRGWAIQLLCERKPPSPDTLAKFAKMAAQDESPLVRLYLAAALQRMPLASRWPIAEALAAHGEDATDANLPLLYWYGIEPAVAADPQRGVRLAARTKIPLLRQFIARRIAAKN